MIQDTDSIEGMDLHYGQLLQILKHRARHFPAANFAKYPMPHKSKVFWSVYRHPFASCTAARRAKRTHAIYRPGPSSGPLHVIGGCWSILEIYIHANCMWASCSAGYIELRDYTRNSREQPSGIAHKIQVQRGRGSENSTGGQVIIVASALPPSHRQRPSPRQTTSKFLGRPSAVRNRSWQSNNHESVHFVDLEPSFLTGYCVCD